VLNAPYDFQLKTEPSTAGVAEAVRDIHPEELAHVSGAPEIKNEPQPL
jgi:hypothetical protein